ncbi:MAG: YqiA/YcfP family alpha/beta fold hydrolase [Planctomycetota bacterium]|jgi:alpha-beta hydrolase superfamily lysophospholipase
MSAHVVYLHGFGSGVNSVKGRLLADHLADRVHGYHLPPLDGGDFAHLHMEEIADRAATAVANLPDDGAPVLVIGSSLGGYTAARLAAAGRLARADALLLLAPAFGFTARWRDLLGEDGIAQWRREGSRPFFHHDSGCEVAVHSRFLDSCEASPTLPPTADLPTVIIHGRADETIDVSWSERYATAGGEALTLHVVEDDHNLDAAHSENLIRRCADELLARISA